MVNLVQEKFVWSFLIFKMREMSSKKEKYLLPERRHAQMDCEDIDSGTQFLEEL